MEKFYTDENGHVHESKPSLNLDGSMGFEELRSRLVNAGIPADVQYIGNNICLVHIDPKTGPANYMTVDYHLSLGQFKEVLSKRSYKEEQRGGIQIYHFDLTGVKTRRS